NLEVEEDQTFVAAGNLTHNCVRKCPFDAIRIIGLPEPLKEDLVHQYSKNGFRLFRLPVPKAGEVIGLLGPNGIGKTTVLATSPRSSLFNPSSTGTSGTTAAGNSRGPRSRRRC